MLTDLQKEFIKNCKDKIEYYKPERIKEDVIGLIIIVLCLGFLTIISMCLGR